jgi:hypothetical protein
MPRTIAHYEALVKQQDKKSWNLFWRDLQRDEATPSCSEVNDLIKVTFGEVSPAIDLADGFLPDASKAQNNLGRLSCPFDALTRPSGHVKKNLRPFMN